MLYDNLDPALKLILLTGQRPGEIAAMQADHIVGGWWQMPGKPGVDGREQRTGAITGSALSEPALALVDLHLRQRSSALKSSPLLKKLVTKLGIERATPHDLRRTCLTTITRLGFGRDAMDRIANHRTNTVTDVYDRHGYEARTGGSWRPSPATSLAWSRGADEQSGRPEVMWPRAARK